MGGRRYFDMGETKSPCIGCDHEHKDKNTERCENCHRRLEYNVEAGHLPLGVLTVERAEGGRKEREADAVKVQRAKPAKLKAERKKPPPPPESPPQRLYDLKQVAQYLGRSLWGIRTLIWDGVLPAVKHGGKLYVDVADLDKFIKDHKVVEGKEREEPEGKSTKGAPRPRKGFYIRPTE